MDRLNEKIREDDVMNVNGHSTDDSADVKNMLWDIAHDTYFVR